MTELIEIPGTEVFSLPPLLIGGPPNVVIDLDRLSATLENGDLTSPKFPTIDLLQNPERLLEEVNRQFEAYSTFTMYQVVGASIIEWTRQCTYCFQENDLLKPFAPLDLWPHNDNSRFVRLVKDKGIRPLGCDPEIAVGVGTAFRHPPDLDILTSLSLGMLPIWKTAYESWAKLCSNPNAAFPPNRFDFPVVNCDNLRKFEEQF
jgi:hypothetical protein